MYFRFVRYVLADGIVPFPSHNEPYVAKDYTHNDLPEGNTRPGWSLISTTALFAVFDLSPR